MKISVIALITLCASCATALQMALDLGDVLDLHLSPIEPVKPIYYRGAKRY